MRRMLEEAHMTLQLYFHPFASFCQKALIAFHEKQVPFEPHPVDLGDADSRAEFYALWPIGRFPVLRDTARGRSHGESSIIVEYVDGLSDSGPPLIPADHDRALAVREWDRLLDNYVHIQMQKIVGDRLRPEGRHDPQGVEDARALIETAFGVLERAFDGDAWLVGNTFTLADCAAAPPLFYAEKLVGFRNRYPRLSAYFGRLLDRPSFQRVIEDARAYRHFFPAGEDDGPWPDE